MTSVLVFYLINLTYLANTPLGSTGAFGVFYLINLTYLANLLSILPLILLCVLLNKFNIPSKPMKEQETYQTSVLLNKFNIPSKPICCVLI